MHICVQVMRMVMAALELGTDAFLEHMFVDCGIIAWLADAPRTVVPSRREGEEDSRERGSCRAGCGDALHPSNVCQRIYE